MRAARRTIATAVFLLAVTAPWGRPATGTTPACEPSGTALEIAAKDKKFDRDCLAAPAGQAFTIAFDNQDTGVPHNVAIYDTAQGDKVLFKGEIIFGPSTTTYSVPAQPAGTYEFRCDPHDDVMIGTFVIGDGRPSTTAPPSSTTTTTGPLGLPELPS